MGELIKRGENGSMKRSFQNAFMMLLLKPPLHSSWLGSFVPHITFLELKNVAIPRPVEAIVHHQVVTGILTCQQVASSRQPHVN